MSLKVLGGILAGVVAILVAGGIHCVDEGFVGVYWRGGALLDTLTFPGFHVKLPFTQFEQGQSMPWCDFPAVSCGLLFFGVL